MAYRTFNRQRRPVRRPPLCSRRCLCRSLRRQRRRSPYDSIIVAPAEESLLFSLSSMTTTIRIHSICACGSVFVVLFVVDDKDDTNSFNFAPAAASLSFALSLMKMKPIQFNHVAPSAASLLFTPSLMPMKPIRFNHVGNQHGLTFIRLLQLGD